MPPTELVLVRHGESEANVGRSKDPDCPLTDAGLEQARRVGGRLAGYDLSGFTGVVSPYRRAVQTAGEIAAATGVEFSEEDAIREWGPQATVGGRAFAPEPLEAAVRRLSTFLNSRHGQKLVVVSHGAPIAILTRLAWGEPAELQGNFWANVGNCCVRWLKTTCAPADPA